MSSISDVLRRFTAVVSNCEEEEFIAVAISGNLESFCYFLEISQSSNLCNAQVFYTALQFAAHHGNTNIVRHFCTLPVLEILEFMRLDNLRDLMGLWFRDAGIRSSPTHLAVKEGHQDVVAELLNFLSRVDIYEYHPFKIDTPEGWAKKKNWWRSYFGGLVEWAVRWGHAPIVQLLLAHPILAKQSLSVPFSLPVMVSQPISQPVHHNHLELIAKEDISLPLHLAAHHNHLEVLRVLLQECKAPFSFPDFSEDGLTVLHLAAQSGSLPVVNLLLQEKSFDVNEGSYPELFTSLHMAANSGHLEVVRLLLMHSSRLDNLPEATISGSSDLSEEAANSILDRLYDLPDEAARRSVLDLLLARDCLGRTALHYAVREGHEGVVQELLACAYQMHANIAGIADHDGLLPLHLAARAGHAGLIRELRSSHVGGINSKGMHGAHMKSRVELEYMKERKVNFYYGESWEYPRPRLVDSFFWKTKGFTPWHFATRYGHEADVTELLVQQHADASLTSIVADDDLVEAASFCKSKIEEENKAMEELRHAWLKGTRPPLRLHIVQWLEDTEIGSVREYWLPRAARNGDLDLLKRLLVLFANFQAIDGDNVEYDCLALHNEAMREALHEVVSTRGGSKNRVITRELLLHLPGIEQNEAVTLMLEALQNHSFGPAKEILLRVPQIALLDNAVARATERWMLKYNIFPGEAESFLMALVTRDGLVGAPSLLRQMLTRAQKAGLEDLVAIILDRPELKRSLYEDRQVFLDCANAILVGAALIVGIAVQGWLQPPLGYSYAYEEQQYVEVQKPLIRTFWKFNNWAFFLAVGALIAGAKGSVPVARDTDVLKSVQKVKRAVAVASAFLGGALVCVVVAFSAAGLVVLPPGSSEVHMMRNAVIWGAIPCALALLWFYWSVLPLLFYYIHCMLAQSAFYIIVVFRTILDFPAFYNDVGFETDLDYLALVVAKRWEEIWQKSMTDMQRWWPDEA